MKIWELRKAIEAYPARSAWNRGVKEYALELIADMGGSADYCGGPADRKDLLNGADNWSEYSEGGCSLIYTDEIAARLCTPSELRRCHNGGRRPSSGEEWLDTQARALNQAAHLIDRLAANHREGATRCS